MTDDGSLSRDQRAALRAGCDLAVELQFTTGVAGTFTANLSSTGMFVRHVSPQPVGTMVRFTLETPEGRPIQGMGEVRWIRVRADGPDRPPGSGIHFRHLPSEDRDRLRILIQEARAQRAVEPPAPVYEKPPLPASLTVPPDEMDEESLPDPSPRERSRPRPGRERGRSGRALPRRGAEPAADVGPRRLPGPLAKLKPRERLLGGLLLAAFFAWLFFG